MDSSGVVKETRRRRSGDDSSSESDNHVGQTNSDGEAKCSEEANSFVPPDGELMTKIIQQIEQYFSDENILKDPFLLKHVRRNKEGYVSLKLIASFRKVKSLTKEWKVVAYSLKRSTQLEVNEEETKVRRKNPLAVHDETTVSRTVLAFDLPFDKPTVENIGEMFSKCGEISLVRILRPGNSIPPIIKRLLCKNPEINSDVYALIEFEKYESADKAIKLMESEKEWHLVPVIQKLSNKETSLQLDTCSQQSVSKQQENNGKKKRRGKKQDKRIEEIRGEGESPFTSSCSEAENSPKPRKRSSGSFGSYISQQNSENYSQHRRGSFGNHKSSPSSPLVNHKGLSNTVVFRPKSYSYCEGDLMSLSTNPRVQKKLLVSNGHYNNCVNSKLIIPERVIRFPKGPDGTKGFVWNHHMFRSCSIR